MSVAALTSLLINPHLNMSKNSLWLDIGVDGLFFFKSSKRKRTIIFDEERNLNVIFVKLTREYLARMMVYVFQTI